LAIIISETQYLGKNLILLKSVPSTNDYAKELLAKTKPKNGTVILADEQTAGRGQAGNIWLTEAGQNITCSIILDTSHIPVNEQFTLNMAVALAVRNTSNSPPTPRRGDSPTLPPLDRSAKVSPLRGVGGLGVIKWPNDILVDRKKIAGILIENTVYGAFLHHSIIGIGLNVNQIDFGENIHATSLKKITGQPFDKNLIFRKLLLELERNFLLLQNKNELKKQYLAHLFQLNEIGKYIYKGKPVSGIIRNVNDAGQLLIEIEGCMQVVNMKEIGFVMG
jgi:BirA family biotin operon repressor/biotin-[acetyl-CoA-carboxylase] ligase